MTVVGSLGRSQATGKQLRLGAQLRLRAQLRLSLLSGLWLEARAQTVEPRPLRARRDGAVRRLRRAGHSLLEADDSDRVLAARAHSLFISGPGEPRNARMGDLSLGSPRPQWKDHMMYARLVSFSGADAEKRESAVATIRERVIPTLREFDGFAGYIGLYDKDGGRAKGLLLWESKETAEAAEPKLSEMRAQVAELDGSHPRVGRSLRGPGRRAGSCTRLRRSKRAPTARLARRSDTGRRLAACAKAASRSHPADSPVRP